MAMQKTIIIAEAGVNHNGSIALAKALIDAAGEAGADYVKFQTFKAKNIASKHARKADYQLKKDTGNDDGQLKMLEKLELSPDDHYQLQAYCKQKGIDFLSTPFDFDSIDLLKSIGMTLGKIPSGEITNLPYLRKMAGSFEKLILSTGMSTIEEVNDALNVLYKEGTPRENIIVLHCTSEYPSPIENVNLKAMLQLQREFDITVGYSDHTVGIEVPVAAVALGASLIEKHFTLDKAMEGPDHAASLDPVELKAMVTAIRNVERALGNGIKEPTETEMKNKQVARKSIVAARRINKGESFSEQNLTVKRPGTGISPMDWDLVLGRQAVKDFDEDDLIIL
ncbi:N-acetylneuraminate synthase [Chitinophaga sp. YIM B06452]|uniref:N-acetylneuraminate synthase n=1 Tax=Chitinophaga sp. YIM B06452 TaxID=3082158 RepID=UPI0031FF1E63